MSDYETVVIHGRWSKFSGPNEAGFVRFEIDIPGKNFPVKADTKKTETIDAMMALRDQDATFTLSQKDSANINPHNNQPYKDRYVQKVEAGFVGEQTSGSSGAARSGGGGSTVGGTREDLSPEAVARIEENQRRDIWSRAWAHTCTALQHTFKTDTPDDEHFARLQSFQRRIVMDIGGEWAMERDQSYLPHALRGTPQGTSSAPAADPGPVDSPPPDDGIPF